MKHKSEYRISDIEQKPGVYIFRDRFNDVIYVGKARSLRKRLANYFQPSRKNTVDPKLRSLINSIEYFEQFIVRNEQEAILLESKLIKEFAPRYNVVLRDDKRFLLLKININAAFPKLTFARLKKDDGSMYFGPFPRAGALRATVNYLNQYFNLRSCSPRLPDEKDWKHCLDHILRYCSAPCIGKISNKHYKDKIYELIRVIEGDTRELTSKLDEKMNNAANKKQYEQAAKYRDIIENINSIFREKNRTFEKKSMLSFPGIEAVEELMKNLNINQLPRVLECFDISNISGSFAVGSMVQFVNGLPAKKQYRRFRIKYVDGIDDFKMIKEVVKRRYQRLQNENRILPDLIIIDGGLGQLHSAHEALQELGLEQLIVIGLAKKNEEIFTLNSNESIVLSRHQRSLKLLQAIRDEAHRFANSYHQKLRQKRIQNSRVDEIPGIGEKRKLELLKLFGSVNNLKKKSAIEIADKLPGIGLKLSQGIVDYLKNEFGKRK